MFAKNNLYSHLKDFIFLFKFLNVGCVLKVQLHMEKLYVNSTIFPPQKE